MFFKIAKFGERPQLARLSLSEPLICADGSTIQDTLDTIIILGPKVNRYGRFRYEKPGSTLFRAASSRAPRRPARSSAQSALARPR